MIKEERLLFSAFKVQVDLANSGFDCWALRIKSALDRLGLSCAFSNPPPPEAHSRFFKRVKSVLSDQSYSKNLEIAGKLPSLKNYVSNKLFAGPESYVHLATETRRAIAVFRLNCTRSINIKHTADYKQCESCKAKVTDVWCHVFYFCPKVNSDILPLPAFNISDHLFHFKQNTELYKKRLIAINKL